MGTSSGYPIAFVGFCVAQPNLRVYFKDGLGTVTSLADNTEGVVNTYEYDAFGNVVGGTGSVTNPYGFTGRILDSESGLMYYRMRYYDPGIGRFITADPIRFQGGINFYTYCLNNPISQIDIYGLLSTCPKGYHREYDNAGFVDCFLLNPETVVVCGVCVGLAVSGVGSGFGVIACSGLSCS